MAASHRLFTYLAVLLALSLRALARDSGWENPDSSRPAFSQTYHNADSIVISWQGLNQSLSDLWLTSYDTTNNYAIRIAANINITEAGTLPWTVTVNDTEIDIDDRFTLRFILTGTTYHTIQKDQFASPGFYLLQRGAVGPAASQSSTSASRSPATGTPGGTHTSTSESTAAVSPSQKPASDSSPGMRTGTKVAIGIVVTVALMLILALMLWVIRLRRRVKAASNHRSAGIVPSASPHDVAVSSTPDPRLAASTEKRVSGLHEMLGDRRHPVELSTKRMTTVYHELAG